MVGVANDDDDDDDDDDGDISNNIITTIKDRILYAPIVILSAKDNQKLSKLSNQNLQELTDCLFLIIPTLMTMLKSIKIKGIIYQKVLLIIIT